MADVGRLQIQVYKGRTDIPLKDARVVVTPNEGDKREVIILNSNDIGKTDTIDLETPPIEFSLDENNNIKPYSTVDIAIESPGYERLIIKGCQIFPDRKAIQPCYLLPLGDTRKDKKLNRETNVDELQKILIPANTLWGIFPPKIPEDEVKPMPPPSAGVVLPKVVVPEYIIVHEGVPSNASAPNYKVPYNDYIKNVASCEIYSTWDEKAIRANIYCIISFTLNRIYTEWYKGKGYKFDITNSTAYDHAFNYGRNIFDNISQIVDEIFSTYVKRSGVKQPLLTQYCDGKRVQCPGWLTQWGSQSLATQGYTPYDILTNFYGTDINLVQAEQVAGSPQSYPGYTLEIGNSGEPVRVVQSFLNRISENYPLIPKVPVDGQYGESTSEQVKKFQEIFSLPVTGKVDYTTWYKISNIYVGVTKIAELRGTISSQQFGSFKSPVPFKEAQNVPEIKYPMD